MLDSKNVEKILALIRISDSFFPLGSYTMSQGVEQLVEEHLLDDESLERLVTVFLEKIWTSSDIQIFFLSLRAAKEGNLEELSNLDRICHVSKITEESRNNSARMGGNLLDASDLSDEKSLVFQIRTLVKTGEIVGTYPVSLAVVATELHLDEMGAISLVYVNLMEIIAALVRLGEIDYIRAQKILHKIISNIDINRTGKLCDLHQSFPMIDIASMRHELNQSRMFAS